MYATSGWLHSALMIVLSHVLRLYAYCVTAVHTFNNILRR